MEKQALSSPPPLRKHTDGYYRASWYTGGKRRRKSFGKKRTDAYDRYYKWASHWRGSPAVRGEVPDVTIADLYPIFRAWQEGRSKNPKSVLEYDYAMKPVLAMYGDTNPRDFTPDSLRTVRREFIESGWSRRTINKRVVQVRAVWKWLVSEGHVAGDTLHALQAIVPLRRGEAPDKEPVKAVDEADFRAARGFMTPTLRAMVDLQAITGMRPGELCGMS